MSNIAPMSAPNSSAKAFYDEFLKQHQKIVAFAPLAYVSTTLVLDALKGAKTKDRAGVLGALQSPDYEFKSILGPFTFDKNGDSKGEKLFFHEIKGGELIAHESRK